MSAKNVMIFVLAAMAALGGLASCNYIGDDNGCVVGFNPNTPQKDCRFGPPVANGAAPGGGCTPIEVDTTATACKGISWSGTVWPQLAGSCAIAGCHDKGDGTAAAQPYLPNGNAAGALKALEGISFACGPYVSTSDPGTSQIINNLTGQGEAGKQQMPPGSKLDDALIATITTWVKCGAPQ